MSYGEDREPKCRLPAGWGRGLATTSDRRRSGAARSRSSTAPAPRRAAPSSASLPPARSTSTSSIESPPASMAPIPPSAFSPRFADRGRSSSPAHRPGRKSRGPEAKLTGANRPRSDDVRRQPRPHFQPGTGCPPGRQGTNSSRACQRRRRAVRLLGRTPALPVPATLDLRPTF